MTNRNHSLIGPVGGLLAGLVTLPAAERPAEFSFEHHPGIRMELWAREPLVMDPVALCFGPDGTGYVVEMADYPYGIGKDKHPGGRVRLLRDTDGDGVADQSRLFAEGLSFPTSITPWRDGVLVTAPPSLIYLRDADGDDVAEVRETWFTGFRRSVTDSNCNGLRWGLDNRIHGVNAGNGGTLRRPDDPGAAPLKLAQWDFAFDPRDRRIALTHATAGGFGLVFNAWGQSFTPHNINYLQQRILPAAPILAEPSLAFVQPLTANISAHGEMARIFPIVEAQTRVNHPEQAGYFSSAGGMGFIDSPLFGPDLDQSIFVCDVASNLVHRDVLREAGPVFVAERAPEEQNREFIASRDPAFRPTGLENGPDGALYLIDMQRAVIEHPDYIPPRIRSTLDLRDGETRGRIWKIVPSGSALPTAPNLRSKDPASLAGHLASPVPWARETAHRMLIESGDASHADTVRAVLRSPDPKARLRALWILHGWHCLTPDDISLGLADPAAGVRENAVALATECLATDAAGRALTTALADPHPRVRFRACLASAAAKFPEKTEALAALSLRQGESIWTFRAILLGIGRDAPQLLKHLGPRLAQWPEEAAEGLARLAAQHGLTPADLGPTPPNAAVIRGLALSLTKDSGNAWQDSLTKWSAAPASDAVAPLFALSRSLGSTPSGALATQLAAAAQTAVQQDAPAAERIRAIAWLAYASDPAPLWKVIDSPSPPDLLRAAFESLRQQSPTDLPQQLLQRWRTLHPSLRPPVVRLLVDRSAYHDALVTALEQKTVTVSELNLDLEQRRELIRWSKPVMAARARKFITDDEYTNRRSSVTEMLAKLPPSGDATLGRQIFVERCAQCHQWNDLGHAVGPSLLGMSHRSTEDLLSHIMDPNMALHPEYLACTIKTTRGDTVAGLLKVETPASVTLLQPMAIATTVSRSEIARMETLTTSLMPEGLESGLSPADLKNLILFLQSKP